MSRAERTVDVLIAGGGMAGLCAALAAAETGAEVTVLEKAPDVGGSARLSGGIIWTYQTRVLQRRLVPEGDPTLQALLAEEFEPASSPDAASPRSTSRTRNCSRSNRDRPRARRHGRRGPSSWRRAGTRRTASCSRATSARRPTT